MTAAALLFSGLAVFAGTLFPIQSAVNARLAVAVGGPVLATLISFAAGCAALSLVAALTVSQVPDWQGLRQMPPWIFVGGGCLGAAYLGLNVFLVPRIGSGAMLALAIGGQMLSALVLDTNGLFGLIARDLTTGRIVGAALVVIGAGMVRFL